MGLTKPRAAQIYDIDYKQATRVITVADITLSGGAPSQVDGVNLAQGDRVLVTGQSTGSQNGIYYVTTLGSGSNGTWSRSSDTDATGELLAGTIVMVTEGTVYHDTQWKLTTNDPIVIGTTALTFEQSSAYAYGNIYANGTAILANTVGDTLTLTAGNNIQITGNATTKNVTIGVTGISLTSIANGTSNVNVTGSGSNVSVGVGGTADVAVFATTGEYVTGIVSASGNVIGANVLTSGSVSATGNVTGSYLKGNANLVTGVNAFSSVVVSGADTIAANSISTALTVAAGNNITLTTSNVTNTLTIAYTGSSSSSIFSTGGDMGLVTESVSSSEDLGSVIDAVSTSYDLGQLGVQGVVSGSDILANTITGNNLVNNITFTTTGNITVANVSFVSGNADVRGWWYGNGNTKSISAQTTTSTDVLLNSTGLKMYAVGGNTIYQYSLSSAYAVSTASYDSISFSFASQDSTPQSVVMDSTNTNLYMLGGTNKTVYQYTLSTSNVGTLAYASKSFSVNSQETAPTALAFNTDLSTMYVLGTTNRTIYQYGLTSAGNVATAVYTASPPGSFSVASQESNPTGLAFNSSGTRCYVIGSTTDSVFMYTLSSAWDITTATYTSKYFLGQQEQTPAGLFVNTNFAYSIGTGANAVFQYNISNGTIYSGNSAFITSELQTSGNIYSAGNIASGNIIAYTSVSVWGNITATGNIAGGNVLAANYFYANGAPFTSGVTVGKSLALTLIFGG